MGIGIAEVAANANQVVKVYDVNYDFAISQKNTVAQRLASRLKRGRITASQQQQILDNIQIVSDLSDLKDCRLIIEAIVENLKIKQNLLQELQEIVADDCLFASNTSSISITAIASVLDQAERMIGLHFFNPAPVMQLVEVVAGMKSSQQSLNDGLALCQLWQKTAVLTQSTPGFIVNRVARPFYGEALKLLQEQVAKVPTIDGIMRAAGFRMGPFRLMDLIGIDINLAVSKTVYAAMYNDPRYRPSFIQEEMVAAQMLGKKSGSGFYDYSDEQKPQLAFVAKKKPAKSVSISTNVGYLSALAQQIKKIPDIIITEHLGGACLQVHDCVILLSNGQTCNQRCQQLPDKHVCQLDLCLDYEHAEIIHVTFDAQCCTTTQEHIVGIFQAFGKKVIIGKDTPALIAMRSVAMLINEAADAIENGVCNENDVDLAMQKGVNYPIGLITWAHKIGIPHVVEVLDNLHCWFGDDRYRVSPWLRQKID